MFPSLKGRINRRTYLIGNLIAIGLLFAFSAIIVLPLAILSLAIGSKSADEIISYFYLLLFFPAILYYFYFSVLMIKRSHDIGWPGFLLVVCFSLGLLLGRINSLWFLNVASLLLLAFYCVKPGSKSRNSFGPAPRKELSLNDLKIHF